MQPLFFVLGSAAVYYHWYNNMWEAYSSYFILQLVGADLQKINCKQTNKRKQSSKCFFLFNHTWLLVGPSPSYDEGFIRKEQRALVGKLSQAGKEQMLEVFSVFYVPFTVHWENQISLI